jgi:hypothetical protein
MVTLNFWKAHFLKILLAVVVALVVLAVGAWIVFFIETDGGAIFV